MKENPWRHDLKAVLQRVSPDVLRYLHESDQRLIEQFNEGISLKEIAKNFGRLRPATKLMLIRVGEKVQWAKWRAGLDFEEIRADLEESEVPNASIRWIVKYIRKPSLKEISKEIGKSHASLQIEFLKILGELEGCFETFQVLKWTRKYENWGVYENVALDLQGSPQEVQIFEWLKANGPASQRTVGSALNFNCYVTRKVLAGSDRIYGCQENTDPRNLKLLPPLEGDYQSLDWEDAVHTYCATYLKVQTKPLMKYMGVPSTQFDQVRPVVEDILRKTHRETKGSWIRKTRKPHVKVHDDDVMELVESGGTWTERQICKRLDISINTAKRSLKRLTKEQRIFSVPTTKGCLYMTPED